MNRSIDKGSFVVRESIGPNIALSLVFFVMFVSAVKYIEFSDEQPKESTRLFYLTIVPAVFFAKKATRRKAIIEINDDGFFYMGSLVTNWQNYISAKISQDQKLASITDNFVLLIEYSRPETGHHYTSKFGLGNTQNESEEDVLAAISHYFLRWRQGKA